MSKYSIVPSTRLDRKLSAYQGRAYDVLDANGTAVGHILKNAPKMGGYSVNVTLAQHALSDDAGGDIWVPDFSTAKVVVTTFMGAPSTFKAPEAHADSDTDFDINKLFPGRS